MHPRVRKLRASQASLQPERNWQELRRHLSQPVLSHKFQRVQLQELEQLLHADLEEARGPGAGEAGAESKNPARQAADRLSRWLYFLRQSSALLASSSLAKDRGGVENISHFTKVLVRSDVLEPAQRQ